MPFQSEAQRRLFYAKERRGEMSPGTVKKWEEHTPPGKLPARKEKREEGYSEQNEGQATGIEGSQLQGFRREGDIGERGEKDASGDDVFGYGNPAEVMPYIRQAWGLGKTGHVVKRADYSAYDIEDLAANNQSYWNPPAKDFKKDSDDAGTQNAGAGNGQTGDTPISETDEGEGNPNKPRRQLNKSAGHVLQNEVDFQGLPIAIENNAGFVRRGKSKEGKEWETYFRHPYGYIKGTKGADGEGIDVYVGHNQNAREAYVVHQNDPKSGKYDEDKVMLGFDSKEDARQAYLDHYDNPKFLGEIKEVSMDRLREVVSKPGKVVKLADAAMEAGPLVFPPPGKVMSPVEAQASGKGEGRTLTKDDVAEIKAARKLYNVMGQISKGILI